MYTVLLIHALILKESNFRRKYFSFGFNHHLAGYGYSPVNYFFFDCSKNLMKFEWNLICSLVYNIFLLYAICNMVGRWNLVSKHSVPVFETLCVEQLKLIPCFFLFSQRKNKTSSFSRLPIKPVTVASSLRRCAAAPPWSYPQ